MRYSLTERTPLDLRDALIRQVIQGIISLDVEPWIYIISDQPWPPHVTAALQAAGAGWKSAMDDSGIMVDPSDPEDVSMFATIAPYSIEAEIWRGRSLLFEARDSGSQIRWTMESRAMEGIMAQLSPLFHGVVTSRPSC